MPRSRPQSRVPSRAGSPALSQKSRKSMMSARNFPRNYINHDLTDDEDSDDEVFPDENMSRSRGRRDSNVRPSTTRRSRKNSTQSSLDFDNDMDDSEALMRRGSTRSSRERRGGSVARSLNEWTGTNRKQYKDRTDNTEKFDRMSLSSPTRKVTSDSLTADSEFEFEQRGRRPVETMTRSKASPEKHPAKRSDIDEIPMIDESNDEAISKKVPPTKYLNEKSPLPPSSTVVQKPKITPASPPTPTAAATAGNKKEPITFEKEWECEYCTFVNEANIKICAICCKTPSTNHVETAETDVVTPEVLALTIESPIPSAAAPTAIKIKNDSKLDNKKTSSIKTSPSEEETDDTTRKKGRRKISFWPGTKTK